ncbi:MAG: amidohydrolase family protein [Planctomycetota bacterium]|nr:amidohydrolase family protein [Planctomycetota bacterium]
MMKRTNQLLLFVGLLAMQPIAQAGDLFAVQVERAETASHGTIEHAVILIDDGKIVMIGEDLAIAAGIPVIDKDPGWIATPALVNCYSRLGLSGRGPSGLNPQRKVSKELYTSAGHTALRDAGVGTLGLYPAGSGIPGQGLAIKTWGSGDARILKEDTYLKAMMRSDSNSKKTLSKGFEEADEYLEKEAKAREKWDKEREKLEKTAKDKDDKEKADEAKEELKKPYVPTVPNPAAEAFMGLRSGELSALVGISKASDYLHFLDALGEEEIPWALHVPITRESDLYHVKAAVGLTNKHLVMTPVLSLHPGTLRSRSMAAEFAAEGAKVTFVPRSDTTGAHESWMRDVGELVRVGLHRETALAALTLHGAQVLRVDDRVGSLEEGKDANILFFDGDPFAASTKLDAVLMEGAFVTGEVNR